MDLKEVIKILEDHNKWRRGADMEMADPTKVGIAIDTIIKYVKEKEKIIDGSIVIFINFKDESFSEYFNECGKSYCKLANNIKYLTSNSELLNKSINRFTNLKYIKNYFINNIIGNFIKNYSDNLYWEDITICSDKIVNINMFKQIKEHAESMTSDIRILSKDEYNKIISNKSNTSLIIEYENGEFNSYIY